MSGRNVLVIGAGQLGTELARLAWPAGFTVTQRDQDTLDVTDRGAVFAAVRDLRPVLVVNAAAYTAVDKAESDTEVAFAVNRDGPAFLAEACAETGAALVHVSTDYVFDGAKTGAYSETDPVSPLGVYGVSKEAGEQAVRQHLPRALILRTAWVFSAHGHNFVKTMLRLAAERDELRVVADQHGCPTAAADLAAGILHAALRCLDSDDAGLWGTYHFCGTGPTTWHGFAQAIIDGQASTTGKRPVVHAITTEEFPTPAKRPANSVLDTRRFAETFGLTPRPWRDGLAEVLEELGFPQG
ncbi:MAG: dTDP-4-dehydrorhamnose reductase [Rhodospirillaceae bacterium BRH_c57]|nr:MAG: dTDP-4-dehydrorhamnose reductase [Rhodospirillaceae bacterium BRH_c57]